MAILFSAFFAVAFAGTIMNANEVLNGNTDSLTLAGFFFGSFCTGVFGLMLITEVLL